MSVLHQDSGWIGKSIPSALEISLGHGFCTPRPSGFPSGFALGKSLGSRGAKPMTAGNLSRFPSTLEISLGLRPREISRVSGNLGRRGWISQSIPRLGGARIQYTIQSVNILHCLNVNIMAKNPFSVLCAYDNMSRKQFTRFC